MSAPITSGGSQPYGPPHHGPPPASSQPPYGGPPANGSPPSGPSGPTTRGAPAPAARLGRVRPATFSDVVRSEATKLRTVRSTWITLAIAVVLTVGLGSAICAVAASQYKSTTDRASFDPVGISMVGYLLAQVAFAVLGVLFVTAEYSTGMIRTSLAAVPRRSRLLGAKLVVFGAVVLVLGEVLAFVSFSSGQAILSTGAPSVGLGDHDVLRAVIGVGLYLAVLSLIAVGLGALLRSTAAAIVSVIALLFVLPAIAAALPTAYRRGVEKYWPTNAGQDLLTVVRGDHTLSAWAGFADMCIFAALVIAAAMLVLQRRDA